MDDFARVPDTIVGCTECMGLFDEEDIGHTDPTDRDSEEVCPLCGAVGSLMDAPPWAVQGPFGDVRRLGRWASAVRASTTAGATTGP